MSKSSSKSALRVWVIRLQNLQAKITVHPWRSFRSGLTAVGACVVWFSRIAINNRYTIYRFCHSNSTSEALMCRLILNLSRNLEQIDLRLQNFNETMATVLECSNYKRLRVYYLNHADNKIIFFI